MAIASRVGIADVITNFGQPLAPAATPDEHDDEPLAEARMISAVCGGVRVVSLYAPNGRVVDSPFYRAKLAWYERLGRWLREACEPSQPLVLGGDFNVAPADADVWDPAACHGGTHVSEPERQAFARLCAWGLVDVYRARRTEPGRYTWWDYRAGNFHKNFGMRIDHLLATTAGGQPGGLGRDRSRSAEGQADALRPHPARARPRRAGPGLRRGLDRRRKPDRQPPRALAGRLKGRHLAFAGGRTLNVQADVRGRFAGAASHLDLFEPPARVFVAVSPSG